MPWVTSMTDEKFSFISDVREKKQIARSSHNRRTHTGKGGAVKFPSDFMTKKEREAMNGECISYKLNEPMSWKVFKSMPTDVQAAYIKALQNKFGVPGTKLAEMFGTTQRTISAKMVDLGVNPGRGKVLKFDRESWFKWLNGVREDRELVRDEIPVEVSEPETPNISNEDDEGGTTTIPAADVVPVLGSLCFECEAQSALAAISTILQNARVKLHVSWELKNDG